MNKWVSDWVELKVVTRKIGWSGWREGDEMRWSRDADGVEDGGLVLDVHADGLWFMVDTELDTGYQERTRRAEDALSSS